jgi:hypothetical protein
MGQGSRSLRSPVAGMGEVGEASPGSGATEGKPDRLSRVAGGLWAGGGKKVVAWRDGAVELGFSPRAGEPDQEVGGQLGGGLGEGVVAGQGGDEVAHGFLVSVVFEEELQGAVVGSSSGRTRAAG